MFLANDEVSNKKCRIWTQITQKQVHTQIVMYISNNFIISSKIAKILLIETQGKKYT